METKEYFEKVMQGFNQHRNGRSLRKYCQDEGIDYKKQDNKLMRDKVVKIEEPIVSIIIATFNSESCIREALESVYNLTLRNWECIIIDGASSDNTIRIVKEFERKDNRFRHISEKDNGIYDAFNKGWKLANGKWIYYLGSDDKLMPDALSRLISSCGKASIVYGDMEYNTGLRIIKKKSIPDTSLLGNMPCHQSMIMKRELIESLDEFLHLNQKSA